MYNVSTKEFLNFDEIKYFTVPIKTDDDRIKPRKKPNKEVERNKILWRTLNPFTGEDYEEYIDILSEEELRQLYLFSSYRRTKCVIFDLVMSNEWDFFVTFTFNKEVVDRFDYEECSDKMKNWLNNVRKLFAPDIKYIIVPERHKNGAWHFHGLFANMGTLDFIDSGYRDKKDRIIYNLYNYKFGFTTATRIEDNLATCFYILKYISKDMCGLLINKKRYWCSRNLQRPKVTREKLSCTLEEFEKSLGELEYQKRKVQTDFNDIDVFTVYNLYDKHR